MSDEQKGSNEHWAQAAIVIVGILAGVAIYLIYMLSERC